MASAFIRKGSPFYCFKIKAADGSWQQKTSRIRIDAPDGERKVKMELLKLESECGVTAKGNAGSKGYAQPRPDGAEASGSALL